MSIESLQRELAALPVHDRRRVQAFLVSIEDSADPNYRRKLASKIDRAADEFATLEQMDQQLGTGQEKQG